MPMSHHPNDGILILSFFSQQLVNLCCERWSSTLSCARPCFTPLGSSFANRTTSVHPSIWLNRELLSISGKSTLFYQSRCSSVTMHFYGGRPCSVYFIKPPTAALSGSGVEDSGEAKKQSINLRRALLGPSGSDKGQISQVVITKVGPCFMSMHFLTNSKPQRFQAQVGYLKN